jgi:hypothetical protein
MKETITRIQRRATEWGKIVASYSTDKELISKIYTSAPKINTKGTNNLIN